MKPLLNHISDFLEYCEIEKGLSQISIRDYSSFLEKFKIWLKKQNLDSLLPHGLTQDHIWQYRLYLSRQISSKTQKPITKATQNYYLIALRSLLAYFVERDILSLPPDKIKLIRDSKTKSVKFLTLEQIEKLLLAPDIGTETGLRDRVILESLFSTGLRIAELVSLNREQFPNINDKKDLELNIIGKGEHPRTVYFSERALSWIKKYLAARKDREKALFIHYRSRQDVETKRLTARSIERIIKKYAILSGVPLDTTPHTIRHSYATDLLAQGVDLRTIQEFLGHKNILTTQIYTHVTNKRLREVHRRYHSGSRLKNA